MILMAFECSRGYKIDEVGSTIKLIFVRGFAKLTFNLTTLN